MWGDKAGEDTERSSRSVRLVQYFWVNVMDDSFLECANGGCSFTKNSESIPDYSTSQSEQISPIHLGYCLWKE